MNENKSERSLLEIVASGLNTEILYSYFSSPEPRDRMDAANVVGRLKLREFLQELRQMLRSSCDGDICESIEALAELGDTESAEEIKKMARHSNVYVRVSVAYALPRLCGEESRIILESLARHGFFEVRATAIDGLKMLDQAKNLSVREK